MVGMTRIVGTKATARVNKGEVSGVTDGVMHNHRIEERDEEHLDDHPREIL